MDLLILLAALLTSGVAGFAARDWLVMTAYEAEVDAAEAQREAAAAGACARRARHE